MGRIIAVGLATLVISGIASAQDVPAPCNAENLDMVQIGTCLDEEYAKADAILKVVYARLTTDQKTNLKVDQRNWLAERGGNPRPGPQWRSGSSEAKGETTQVGLDFRTGLGQLVQAMDDPEARHALAVPNTATFRRQLAKVPDRVRKALRVHRLVVQETGLVVIVGPSEPVSGSAA